MKADAACEAPDPLYWQSRHYASTTHFDEFKAKMDRGFEIGFIQ
jgi:hypothetical protein